ncbi:DNA/RNA helicase domain-containing protein [Niallia taxi]|uniref:DNA/RNA helicase domain-containing protein n=1 Tax=Niallia taxi TaxID=2499688 RepID=UPI003D2C1C69
MNNFGWKGSLVDFIEADRDEIVNSLCMHIYNQTLKEAKQNPNEESTISQIKSWYDCIAYLKEEIPYFKHMPGFLIFEYEILRSGRCRPDVLLFLPGEVLVLEFKRYSNVNDPEYAQTSFYIRDIQQYHSAVQEFALKVRGALVVTTEEKEFQQIPDYQMYQLGKRGLRELTNRVGKHITANSLISAEQFLEGTYQPLPTIIESARAIMRDEPLPQIKTLKSSNFNTVVAEVKSIIEMAQQNQTHHLVLVSGVPGAGKTFVGLTLAHEIDKAVYLSGNGPLVDVLQDSLKNKTFVQALYGYKADYLKYNHVPEEHVLIFDEAQRAWDAKRMKINKSEPDVMIEIAKQKTWSVVVGLIGEGQEIHIGEEGGIGLWNEAINDKSFHVHAKHHQQVFSNAYSYHENHQLHLNTSLRTHNALMYFEWVEAFINNDREKCKILEEKLRKERFTLKIVDNLQEAKEYVQKVYEGTDKTYGIVASSSIKYPKGVKLVPTSARYVIPKAHVEYFNYPESEYYCKRLDYAATEFQVQGLELDMAIVCWGNDLSWENGKWKAEYLRKGAEDPEQLKLNVYRVLLTRGRDGVIICRNL